MPRGLTDSFVDGLARLLQEVSRLKIAPDADLDWLNMTEASILDRIKGGMAQGEAASATAQQLVAESDPNASNAFGPGPGPEPVPVEPAGQTRGPTPSPDMRAPIEELSRVMAGS